MYDSIVIGGGPSGMTAALYLLRAGKKVLLIEKESIGGQISKSPRLENFPSIESISGLEFADRLFEQISKLGVDFEFDTVESIKKENDIFTVKTSYGSFEGKTAILATGCHHRPLGVAREEELVGKGISYCATCDGDFFRGKDVIVIGDANTALQYAVLLSSTSSHVQIVTLFDHFFADPILVERIKAIENIDYVHEFNTEELLGETELTGVRFKHTKTGEEKIFYCAGCFICVGQMPENGPFADLVDLNKAGFIIGNEAMETKTPGLYVCGDCREKKIRQVVTATNDGAIAAVSATNYLNLRS